MEMNDKWIEKIMNKLWKIKNKKRGIVKKNYFLKNSMDFTRPTVPVIITSPPGAAW